jgi:hypothetical protein
MQRGRYFVCHDDQHLDAADAAMLSGFTEVVQAEWQVSITAALGDDQADVHRAILMPERGLCGPTAREMLLSAATF